MPARESAGAPLPFKTNSPRDILVVVGVITILLLRPGMSAGQASQSTNEPAVKKSETAPTTPPNAYAGPGPQPKIGVSDKTPVGEMWGDHSYLIPAAELIAFEASLNLFDRAVYGKKIYGTTFNTFTRNLQTAPVLDTDSFQINQLEHPYAGSMYFGFGRSAGLSYWQSLMFSIGGSELWETAGETDPPSLNDHIATGIGGSFLGEPLFRMASLLLEGGGEHPGFGRELGAAIISPATGINRLLFGKRFDKIFPSRDPAMFMRLRLGMSLTASESDNGPSKSFYRPQATADFLLEYGLPGQAGYTYDRPFDYFDFEFALGNGKGGFENITSRGLIYGTDYDLGDNYNGIWGVYGSYDYISPHIFRVSSTALSLGTTAQWWLTQKMALQYSILGGVGYAAAGTINGPGDRNYRYGVAPQGLQAGRLIFGRRAMVDLNVREYYISDSNGSGPSGYELIGRANAGFTVRLFGRHALGLQFTASTRDAREAGTSDRHQTEEVFSVAYTLLGRADFGAVER